MSAAKVEMISCLFMQQTVERKAATRRNGFVPTL